MSDTRFLQGNMKPKKEIDNLNEQDNYKQLIQKNNQLYEENKVLKDLILEKQDNNFHSVINNEEDLHFHPKKTSFYIQIVIGILVIILSLGFHIVYLAVTDCLMYNGGNSECWIKSWLGINLHASFFLDLFLYSLIFLQVILIILIIRNKINEFRLRTQ